MTVGPSSPCRRRRALRAAPLVLLLGVPALAGCGSEQLRVEAAAGPSATAAPTNVPDVPQTAGPLDNIRNLDLRSTVLKDARVPAALRDIVRTCRLCGLDDPEYVDLTKDRIADVIVPINGGNGPAGAVAYTVVDSRPRLLLAYSGAFADVRATPGGDLSVTEQLYGPDDPACCATGPRRTRVYTWNGRRMVLRSTAGDRPGYAPYEKTTRLVL